MSRSQFEKDMKDATIFTTPWNGFKWKVRPNSPIGPILNKILRVVDKYHREMSQPLD